MGQLWAFDCAAVAARSLTHEWIKDASYAAQLEPIMSKRRAELEKEDKIRNVEDFPLHFDMAANRYGPQRSIARKK